MRSPRFSLRPRTLLITMVLIVAVAAVAVWLTLGPASHPGRVRFEELSEDSTSTVSLAGVFPAEDRDPLANPLGIVTDGELVYVAESDAGMIRIFDPRGGEVGSIGLPKAKGMTAVYPSSLALAGEGRLAVVDNAAARVVVVSTESAGAATIVTTLGGTDGTGQPTSVAYADGEYFVFDSASSVVRVYDDAGEAIRVIGADLEPRASYAASMSVVDGTLFLADSNGARVIGIDASSGEQRLVFEDRYALPRALTPMDSGGLAVVDTFDRAVYLTDGKGSGRSAIDAVSVPGAPLSSPRGVAWVSADRRLYVTDAATGRIVVYNIRAE